MILSQMEMDPLLPQWLFVLLLFLGLGATFLQYRWIRRRIRRSQALGLSLLRLGVIALLLLFILNISWVEKREQKGIPSLAILVDSSQSMELSGSDAQGSRLEEVKSLLLKGSNPLLQALLKKYEVRLYALGESIRRIDAAGLAGLKAGGNIGDLTKAVDKLAGSNSLLLLLSAGNLKWEGDSRKNLPLLIVPVGNLKGYKDILIKEVKAPALAFRGREVPIEITLKGYGYPGLIFPVLLKDGNRLLTAKNCRLNNDSGEVTITLSFTPEEVGEHDLSLSVPPQFGETLTSNNTIRFSTKVLKDKIRILMISGTPSWGYRLMRTAFKNDPSIDLLSFVILRTPSDVLNVPEKEQSLIPFPVETLFSKELQSFDLLIFDNFLSQLYFGSNYLEKLREYVKEGGGFAMIGGPNLVGEGGYAGTPVEEILPLHLIGGREGYRQDSSFGVGLTPAGATHPITRLAPDERDNFNLWQEMPPLDGINLTKAKNPANVLLESDNGTHWPILTVGNYGKGRVLVLATNYSWKWYMAMVAKEKSNWAYLRLMERIVRWVTQDPSLDPIQIILPENSGGDGQEVEFRIILRGDEISSKSGSGVSLAVFDPDGVKISSQVKPANPGEFLGSFSPGRSGTYKLKVETPASSHEESFIIRGVMEGLDAAPDHDRLRMISESAGGKLLLKDDSLQKEIENYAASIPNHFIEERRQPLRDFPLTIALILVMLSAEWTLRRRWGFV